MAVGLPSNAEEGTLDENPSDHPNEESLKVMRDQKRHFDATARHKSKVRNTMKVIHLLGQKGITNGKKKRVFFLVGGGMHIPIAQKEKQPKYVVEIEKCVLLETDIWLLTR